MNEVRKSQIMATPSRKHFEPSRTLVGIQEMGSRFAVTPQKGNVMTSTKASLVYEKSLTGIDSQFESALL